jgi:condensin complex subunit 3
MAFKLQEEYNLLEELTPADEIDQDEPLPVEYVERTFVVAELCKMAVNLDYSDEIGRRKMFQLARKCCFCCFGALNRVLMWGLQVR